MTFLGNFQTAQICFLIPLKLLKIHEKSIFCIYFSYRIFVFSKNHFFFSKIHCRFTWQGFGYYSIALYQPKIFWAGKACWKPNYITSFFLNALGNDILASSRERKLGFLWFFMTNWVVYLILLTKLYNYYNQFISGVLHF